MRKRRILVADLLCGAGGSSTGAARALAGLGLEMELVCVNHWPVAIETHQKNHPQARHYVQDIATVRPHLLVPEGYLDLLMASPTCTHHSVARGGKPTSDQQRSDPWHIITWLTELRVKRIIIENVWEFTGWGPVDARTGKPVQSRKGEYFRAWIDTIRRLGFDPEWRKLNAANYGDATTRQRFILKARSDRVILGWAPITHHKREDGKLELFPGLKPWRPAREIIDWSIKGRSIFDRKKPLAPKTLARIHAGAVKFGWPAPFLVILRNHMDGKPIDGPLPAIAAEGNHIGLAEAVILGTGNGGAARSAEDPLPTVTTGGAAADGHKGCARPMIAEPVIVNGRRGNQAKPVSTEPVPTLDTKGGVWLAEPFVLGRNGTDEGDDARRSRSVDEPMPTSTNRGAGYVIEPFVLSQGAGGVPREAAAPLPTIPTHGAHALVAPYYGSGSGETCKSAEEPLDTVPTRDRFGLVVPITHSDGANRARDVETEGLPTITGANRGELAMIVASHGERPGQSPRVHDVDAPAPTIAATGRIDLAQAAETGARKFDILFRMLEPHELAAAMGFNSDDQVYEFAGTKTEKIKQIGNAVSVAMMAAEVREIMMDAARKAPRRAAAEPSTITQRRAG